jgi:hypothetical protein
MNQEDAERWRQALSAYHYPVARDRIVRFANRIDAAAPWFNFDLSSGTRDETIDFEQRFRSFGLKAIKPWFEVIFWKLASMISPVPVGWAHRPCTGVFSACGANQLRK